MQNSSIFQRGFTLIELLVTVAIIAILAAIAVPNFLEAQVRAKVSRAKADMRTIVTALETYRVDNNHYPTYHYANLPSGSALEFHLGGAVTGFAQSPDFEGAPWFGRNPITSPVAYLTSMPDDPFMARKEGPRQVRQYMYVNWDYAITNAVDSAARELTFRRARVVYGSYRLHSRGPDRQGPNSGVPYDPTNGTVSDGDITYGPNAGYDKFQPFTN